MSLNGAAASDDPRVTTTGSDLGPSTSLTTRDYELRPPDPLARTNRYASGVLAVTFSAVLIALQCGLLLGLFKITSIPIDHTTADLWVGSTAVPERGPRQADPESYITPRRRAARRAACRSCTSPTSPTSPSRTGGTELCFLLGSKLDDDAAGAATVLTQEQRERADRAERDHRGRVGREAARARRDGGRQAEDQRQGSHASSAR